MRWDRPLLKRLFNPLLVGSVTDEDLRLRDYQEVFSTDAGKRVLEHICRRAGVVTPMGKHLDTTGRIDPNQVLLNEGARVLALDITRDASVDWFERRLQLQEEKEPEL